MAAMKASGKLSQVRRVGIVGPGLDFSDKAEGYDFYPQQTIQPFGVVDSLLRLGFSRATDLSLTTFDLSPRVNQHLEAARQRAAKGSSYVLQLPLDMNDPAHDWHPDLVNYWRKFGSEIGVSAVALRPPRGAEGVQVRAIRVRPSIVSALQPRDANIVLERTDDGPFDLIVATNVLVYYDAFEQALALANVAKMLRPGGFLLTNYAVSPLAPIESEPSLVTPVFWDRQGNGDTLFWYQRR
jgi:SAM-dependent methyltransferase